MHKSDKTIVHSNISSLATTVDKHADKLGDLKEACKRTQNNLTIRLSNLEALVTAIGQELVEDGALLRTYHECFLDLKGNLTEMHETDVAGFLGSDRNDSLLRSKLESLQQHIGVVSEHLEHADQAVEQLGTKIGHPVNIFSKCKKIVALEMQGMDATGKIVLQSSYPKKKR